MCRLRVDVRNPTVLFTPISRSISRQNCCLTAASVSLKVGADFWYQADCRARRRSAGESRARGTTLGASISGTL